MIKTIRDFIEKPTFMAICDESCGQFMTAVFEPGPNEDQQQAMFVGQLLKGGWKVSFDRQTCPQHAQKTAREQNLIIMPTLSMLKN